MTRNDEPKTMTAEQVARALAWVTTSCIGAEAVQEIQKVCEAETSGLYDEATAKAVFTHQQKLGLVADGMAGETFCRRTGLIFTRQITAASVADDNFATVRERFPNGVTVAICPDFENSVSQGNEFKVQADIFAKNQQAVGISGGEVVLGKPCLFKDIGEVIELVQSIHRGLKDHWEQHRAERTSTDDVACTTEAAPAYTKVLNLALFCHGESWGMGLNAKNRFREGGLYNKMTNGVNPANVEALVRGLSDAVVSGVRVELFACSTAHDTGRSNYDEWTEHKQGDKAGSGSFASSMAQAFGKDATVSGHTTAGHTTENYAARVFGAEAGGGTEGITLFDSMYPEPYVQEELRRLFPDTDAAGRMALHDSLREQMYAHFKDAVLKEHQRTEKRYPVPMGQETFTNPTNARSLLDADWKANWIPFHINEVKTAPVAKK